jgi:hypothetical protein
MKQTIPFVLATLAIIAACDVNNPNGPQTGTVKGTLTDTANNPFVGIRVVITPPTGDSTVLHTGSTGSYQLDNVPVGIGGVQIDSLPAGCPTIPPQNYFLESPGTTAQVNAVLACNAPH